ncbi:transposase, partial [Polluticaenibacter yanchengensis]|nr:transposase [Chitinophagaceae bacterium LY-5]
KQIEKIEVEIMSIINSDEVLKRNYEILLSIKGVGPVNAMMTLAYTENFSAFKTAREYASYVGVAPFEHSSGTSIKGKTRTSKLRRSDLKSELTMAARSAKQWNKDLATYAQRIKPNKHIGIVINNVAFKLICLMFSLVKRNELYVENYRNAA